MLSFLCAQLYHHQHHHVVPPARISLTLSRHFSLSFIASSRSSGLHPVSSQSCCTYVRGSRPAFTWPYVGVHKSTSLMSSSLLLQQYPACLVRLIWIVFVYYLGRGTMLISSFVFCFFLFFFCFFLVALRLLLRLFCYFFFINRKRHRHTANEGMDSYR